MTTPITLSGTLKPDGTLELNQKPNLPPGPVLVTVQPALPGKTPQAGLAGVIDEIRQHQQARGIQGRSAEEIDAGLNEGEAEYEKKMQALRPQTKSSQVGGS